MMDLTVVSAVYAENGMWFVDACLYVEEIIKEDARFEKLLKDKSNDGLIRINGFIEILKSKKTLYKKYADFIEVATGINKLYDQLADYVYELCKLVKYAPYDLLRDENGDLFDENEPKELVDLVDYLTNKKELELTDLCSEAWEYMHKSDNWNDWLFGKIEMTMFLGKPKRASEEFDLLWILKAIKEQMGINYWVHWIEDGHVWVTFKLNYKEHFMQLDELIFDETKTKLNKAELILDRLIYYFDLEEFPVDEFKKAIEKEFYICEADDNETVNVNVITDEDKVEVTITNNETGEERIFEGWIDEEAIEEDTTLTFESASRLGYKMAHLLLIDYWNL